MIHIGFDISTVCIGWCVLDADGSYMDIGHVDLAKEENFYKKIDIFSRFIDEIGPALKDAKIFVEEPVKMFAANKSMAQTISKLTSFNAACRYVIYSKCGVEPIMIMPSSARKAAGLMMPKSIKGKETKLFVLDYVKSLKTVPEDKWGAKRTGNPTNWSFDRADAYIVALGGLNKNAAT
jgi:hypothetical protein